MVPGTNDFIFDRRVRAAGNALRTCQLLFERNDSSSAVFTFIAVEA